MRALGIAAALLGCALGGCVLVASSSTDYVALDGGGGLACKSAQDCPSGEGGPLVCCLTTTGSACQGACIAPQPQLCKNNNECGATSCTPQVCFGTPFYACGVVSCTLPEAGQ